MATALGWLIWGVILAVMAGVLVAIVLTVVEDTRDRVRDYRASAEARDLDRARNVTGRVVK